MKVVFLLPGYAGHPSGGFKVVYEHASRLAERGHEVTIVHADMVFNGVPPWEYPVRVGAGILRKLKLSYRPGEWYAMSPAVQMRTAPTLAHHHVPEADVVVATSWHTAESLRNYPPEKGAKVYFIQDYEHLMTVAPRTRARMLQTYREPFRMLTIAPVIQEVLRSLNVTSSLIPNAINHDVYHVVRPIDDVSRTLIGFPYRKESFKGTQDVVTALGQIMGHTDLGDRVWAFGSVPRPILPSWVRYIYRPTDDQLALLYNQTRVFIVGSHFEGWGLPGMEAMACGATLVSTANGGVEAYATHEGNALLSPAKDTPQLASNVLSVLKDPSLGTTLAGNGVDTVRRMTWTYSCDLLEDALNQALSSNIRGDRLPVSAS